jgi:hypothetical protein
MRRLACFLLFLSCFSGMAHASVFGQIQGIVHDPHHRPIAGARIVIRAAHSDLSFSALSDQDGNFRIPAVPLGVYVVSISNPGFADLEQAITVSADSSAVLHFPLNIATVTETASVRAESQSINPDSATPSTIISRTDIAQTPGADRTNSLAMITDYVPGAYMTHDMLHMRGGHQLSWMIDGVNLPNTNIASNIGPQIDPKDIDTIEVERGSYGADVGDRTYGVFNVVPRTGFERNRDGELVLTLGNFYQTNNQISFGDHTEKFAWFTSLNGNRGNYGLQPAIERPIHDAENGYGGFASFIYNPDQSNQLRLVTQLRTDYYQIPYDPNVNDWQNQLYNSSGLRDGQHETDGYAAFTWMHTWRPATTLACKPRFRPLSQKIRSPEASTATPSTRTTPSARSSTMAASRTSLRARPSSLAFRKPILKTTTSLPPG